MKEEKRSLIGTEVPFRFYTKFPVSVKRVIIDL